MGSLNLCGGTYPHLTFFFIFLWEDLYWVILFIGLVCGSMLVLIIVSEFELSDIKSDSGLSVFASALALLGINSG